MTMPRVRSLDELRSIVKTWKTSGKTVGLVPTMGALHNGHLSLVRSSVQTCDYTIATIFVNPTQFAAGEDLDTYPRNEDSDCEMLEAENCDLAFCPDARTVYPTGEQTRVSVPELGAKLEGQFRPHFFGGVATVVTKLFNMVDPDFAFFGEKDFQQVQIIKRMVTDLAMPVSIVACPTERTPDGLAMSSRNAYLTETERKIAPALNAAMHRAAIRIRLGHLPGEVITEAVESLRTSGFDKIEYLEACDPETLEPIIGELPEGPCRLIAAAWLGKTRLIDNIAI